MKITNLMQQSFSLEIHQKLNPNLRPKATEKNTGCFTDMLQRAKNVELNKLNSVNKTQEIWKSLRIDKIQTSYLRMAEQIFPSKLETSFNISISRGREFYDNLSRKDITQSFYSQSSESKNEIGKIDFYI